MRVSKTTAAVMAALAVVGLAVLCVVADYWPAAAPLAVSVLICIAFLYIGAASNGAASSESGNLEEVAKHLESVLDGGRPDPESMDEKVRGPLLALADKLENLSSDLVELSPSDELTSLAKEAVFNNVLWREFNRAQRYGEPMSVVLLETVDLRETVEKQGADEGDRLLKRVASVILQMVRESDLAARYGEDRFAIIMPQTGAQGALEFAHRFRKAMESGAADGDGQGGAPVVALGAASVPNEEIKTAPDLVARASRALLESK